MEAIAIDAKTGLRIPASEPGLLVAAVDDDESVRESLPPLLRAFGYDARAFSSAEEFLQSGCIGETRCLILDVSLPGMSGPELQRELKNNGHGIPIVFITGRADSATRQRLLEQGAIDCLCKPFSETALRRAIVAALETG